MKPKWVYPKGWDDANMADPAVYHAWQDEVADLNQVCIAEVDAVHPCGCDDCRDWREANDR